MKKKLVYCTSIVLALLLQKNIRAQNKINELKLNLNDEGTHFIQATFLNQVWLRYNQSNPGTTVEGVARSQTFDIGLRRTRMQLFGQLTDKVFVYFQFGQNNFNSQFNIGNNRKSAAFFHDAVCEYKVTQNNGLKLGAGLTIANGLSRFSQPGIGSIMTMDVPVFGQATVDQTDQFSRKLSVYARGQVSHLDYRFSLSDPFPVNSNGSPLPSISRNATFSPLLHHKQYQTYLMWQFFEHENHTTPYMNGTYLGKKRVFNIAVGGIWQKAATWRQSGADTVYDDMLLTAIESFLDIPLNAEKGTAFSAYAGYFNTNYGNNYLRFNGIMNPANGTGYTTLAKDAGPMFGNAVPMFGTGQVIYSQLGYLLPKKLLGEKRGQLMPYVSATLAQYKRLNNSAVNTYNAGINWLLNESKSKITLDYQSRPSFIILDNDAFLNNGRKSTVTLQYQIFL